MKHPTRIRHLLAAATATLALVASSCAEDAPPPRAAPTATSAPETPTTTEAPPEERSVCDDPTAEDLGDGFFKRGDSLWEDTEYGCLFRPNRPEAEAAPEAEADVVTGDEADDGPVLTAEPAEVPEGPATVTLTGEGFEPGTVVGTVACDTLEAVDAVLDFGLDPERFCDFSTIEVHETDDDGGFTAVRDFDAGSDVVWVAADATDPLASAPVAVQATEPGPEPEPEPGAEAEADPQPEPVPGECPDGQHAHDGEGCHPDETAEPEQVPPPPDDWHCVEVGDGVVECAPTDDYICEDTAEGRVCDPKDAETAARVFPEPEPEPEPAPSLLPRCTEGSGAGRVRVLTGTTGGGAYSLEVDGGPDACERIKTWFTEALTAQRQNAAGGYFPCEYDGPDDLWTDTAPPPDPAVLVGCWPTVLATAQKRAQIAKRLAIGESRPEALAWAQGHSTLPPNNREMIEALWGCYHEALAGPPVGYQGDVDRWPTVNFCNGALNNWGNPVRNINIGVDPACAAEHYSAGIEEFKERGTAVVETLTGNTGKQVGVYAGAFSWANCETRADRLLGFDPDVGTDAPFAERCAVVVAASAHDGDGDPDWAAQVEDAFCGGTGGQRTAHLTDTADRLGWPLADDGANRGAWIASWLVPEGSVCYEKALLNAAAASVYRRAVKVQRC